MLSLSKTSESKDDVFSLVVQSGKKSPEPRAQALPPGGSARGAGVVLRHRNTRERSMPAELQRLRSGFRQFARQPPGSAATTVAAPPPPFVKGKFAGT